jgi:CxxC motif-containing protein (DUF1111 family)
MARAGEVLFKHVWEPHDKLAPGGDGLGPVYNATSCVACHKQGGVGGAGGLEHNVTTFTVQATMPGQKPREGVIHASFTAPAYRESMHQVDPAVQDTFRPPLLTEIINLQPGTGGHCPPAARLTSSRNIHFSQRNTPALFGAQLIDQIPERAIIANARKQQLQWGLSPASDEDLPVGRVSRLANGRIGRFGWKGQSSSLSDFVQAACANELGLGNPGQAQPRPISKPSYLAPGLDLTIEQCDQLTAFVASLPRPVERVVPNDLRGREQAHAGKKLFNAVGCADCHTPDLGPAEGVYSDLLLHRMGQDLEGGGSYNDPPPVPDPDSSPGEGPHPGEWRTPPLWGVADSAPYLHDGRAANLEEAIRLHGGQGARAARRFAGLSIADQGRLVAYLKTLKAPGQ